jgi:hypothetical protein
MLVGGEGGELTALTIYQSRGRWYLNLSMVYKSFQLRFVVSKSLSLLFFCGMYEQRLLKIRGYALLLSGDAICRAFIRLEFP